MKIGFFDSGLGGLIILKSAAAALPEYDYVYFGDTENLPYGDKSEEEIFQLTKSGVERLFAKDCVLVVIACNTASAETLRKLQDEWLPEFYPDRKILGVIVPTIETVLESNITNMALIATRRTVESNKYVVELNNRSSVPVTITQIATPELVPLIELNELPAAAEAAALRIESEAGESAGVILGCTHYSQIKQQLRDYFGSKKVIFSQDEIIPEKLAEYLARHPEIENKLSKESERSIALSKHRPDYDIVMSQMLGGVYMDQ